MSGSQSGCTPGEAGHAAWGEPHYNFIIIVSCSQQEVKQRMKRMIPILALVAGLVLVLVAAWLAQPVLAQDGEEDEAGGSLAAWRGAALYAEFCQACHGPRGEALGEHPAFAAVEYDPETAQDVIAHGLDTNPNDGVAMPPYAGGIGGLLDGAQIDDLIAFMETWRRTTHRRCPEPKSDDRDRSASPATKAIRRPGRRYMPSSATAVMASRVKGAARRSSRLSGAPARSARSSAWAITASICQLLAQKPVVRSATRTWTT